MILKAKQAMVKLQRRWQIEMLLVAVIYPTGPAVLFYFLFYKIWLAALVFAVIFGSILMFKKPWKLHLKQISVYIDEHLQTAEFSSSLLLLSAENLSGVAGLQQQRTAHVLAEKIGTIQSKNRLFPAVICLFCFLFASFLVYKYTNGKLVILTQKPVLPQENVVFQALDSTAVKIEPPVLESQKLIVTYPKYTGIAPFSTSKMNIRALEGSRLQWKLKFDQPVDSVAVEFLGKSALMHLVNQTYSHSKILDASGFYNFRFRDSLGAAYTSELHNVEMFQDQPPLLTIDGLQPFISFDFAEGKQLIFSVSIADDFGIAEAHITATVSRGTGESVKFREERLAFDTAGKMGGKHWQLSKKLDLDSLKMEPGDELYFYLETTDLKTPKPNISRSETFFAVVKDTVTHDFAVEGTLGVDRMPDYFRSQRQLIIDTEKLIKNRKDLSAAAFNKKSNELGSEQSGLRLKYGRFMGDENAGAEEHEHEHEGEENPIADYMHDHDGNNEHNLVEDDGKQARKDSATTGKPNQFEQSLHSKMRQALNEMWASERHLRVNKPPQSLPYQHRALNLLQEIKNSARIYVHRIGFDPPPIKEDVRLTGKIKEVNNYRKTADLKQPETERNMRKTVAIIEQILTEKHPILGQNQVFSDENRAIFRKAGKELAQKAINEPGKYLLTLQALKSLSEQVKTWDAKQLQNLQSGLLRALTKAKESPVRKEEPLSDLNTLFLQELGRDD